MNLRTESNGNSEIRGYFSRRSCSIILYFLPNSTRANSVGSPTFWSPFINESLVRTIVSIISLPALSSRFISVGLSNLPLI